ncbi:MAG: extracellular solute-binding protein [Chloroflexi bacterium]|nr:extracellular solute-binding protein [Chloroflexota bacterium]
MLIRLIHMKKSKSIILLSMLLLAACGAGEDRMLPTATGAPAQETATATATIQPTATATPAARQEQTLTFWHPWTGVKAQRVAALVDEYNQSNQDGITVETVAAGDEDFLVSKIQNAIEERTIPDIVAVPSGYLRSLYEDLGLLATLNDYVTDEINGVPEEEQRTIPTLFWQQDVWDGVRYGVPAEYKLHLLYYNQSWARELGFDNAPSTSEEFLNQACTAASYNANDADDENNGTGGWIYAHDALSMLSWMQVFGGGEIPSDPTRGFDFNTPENQDAMEFLRTIYQLDCAWTGKENTPYRYFSKLYALFYSGSSADWYTQVSMDAVEDNNDAWTVIPYPGNTGNPIVNGESLSYGIFQTTPEQEAAAWHFVHWMMSGDVQTNLVEDSFSVPVNLDAVQQLGNFLGENPDWQSMLAYVPLAKPVPVINEWNVIGNLLDDAGWQLSLYNVKEADIPSILENLENLLNEVVNASQ